MANVILLSNVRLSFPHLVEPQKAQQPNPETGVYKLSYNCDIIIPESDNGYKQFMAEVAAQANEKWKTNAANVLKLINAERKLRCYGAGSEKVNKRTFESYDGYANNMYITAGRETMPQIIQADGRAIDPQNTMAYQQLTRKMYGGCRVNVALKPWLQENKYGRGVRCDLVAIQFAGDDKAFGEGAVDVSGLFASVSAPAADTSSMFA